MILGNRLTTIILWSTGEGRGSPASGSFRVQVVQNGLERDAFREGEIGRHFKERPEHKATIFHVVMRYGEAFSVNHLMAEQHNIEIKRARPQRSALRTRPCCSSMR